MSINGFKVPIIAKKINNLKGSKEKENKKIKLSSNKLNTQVIFINKNEKRTISKEIDLQKIKNTKTINNNSKQIFKKINLKIASQLVKKDLLKINPNLKTEIKSTIEAMKNNFKNSENNIIRTKLNLNTKKNKSLKTISEPLTDINSRNDKNRILEIKKNPFILISQPIEPMTIEMEKFKKMRMSENKNYLEKKSKQKIPINNNNKKIARNKTNIISENLMNSQIFNEEQNNKYKGKNILYKSYKESINNINKIQNEYNLHKKSFTNKNLKKKYDRVLKSDLNNEENDINFISLRNSKIESEIEKNNNLKTLAAKPNSSLNLESKNKIKKIQKIKRSSFKEKKMKKKIDKNKIGLNLNIFESKLKKKISTSLNTYQKNAEKNQNIVKNLNKSQNEVKININTLINKEKNNELIKKKFEKIILIFYNKKIIEFFFNQMKKMIIIKNVNKSKEQPLYTTLKKKDKIDETYKKHLNLIIEKLNTFIFNYNKSLKIKAYNKFKTFIKSIKKLEAIKKVYNSLLKIIFGIKNKSFKNFRIYYRKTKQKEFVNKIQKILLKNFSIHKKSIFKEMIYYYNNHKKLEKLNKIRDLLIKMKKYNIKKIIDIFKKLIEYKKKLKSIINLFALISNKIYLNKQFSYNKIKKFIIGKRKIEGFYRIKDIFTKMKINKLRIFFFDFVNNITKIKINAAFEKLTKIFLYKRRNIKKIFFNKLKKIYEEQIIIKNKRNNTERRWENNIIDNNMNIIQISSNCNKISVPKKNSTKEEKVIFIYNKKEKENNINITEDESDNIIWTTSVEKWGVIYNSDDSLYEENKDA